MLLEPSLSRCDKNQKIVISSENKKIHKAINPDGKFDVRQYRLDGELIKNKRSCDYLVLNDTTKKAYYIELKGRDISKAVTQLKDAETICKSETAGYISYFRIVASKTRTAELKSPQYRHMKQDVGNKRFICKISKMEETLD